MNLAIIKKIKSTPKNPGVYLFYPPTPKASAGHSKNHQPLYIGKAANLKSRLNSYLKPIDIKTSVLNKEANRLKLIRCESPIAALIEESKQIKRLQPKLNVYWRDDKQYFYVAFTKEKFPRIYITHQPARHRKPGLAQALRAGQKTSFIGPFTDGSALKLILRIIRRRYLYCTCKESHLRQCLNSQINLCPGFCCDKKNNPTKEQTKTYDSNLKIIKSLLSGSNKKLLERITKPSDRWAAENIFSHSQYLNEMNHHRAASRAVSGEGSRRSVGSADHLLVACGRPRPSSPAQRPGIAGSKPIKPQSISKIECYDASNLSGKEAVGAMTVLVNDNGEWKADKNQFRKFRIKTPATRDDPKMIAEIVSRRLKHTEWPYPDLIIVDGGKTQYNAVKKITGNLKVIGFAKPNKQIIGLVDGLPVVQVIEKAIRQTHRFAISYHRHLRQKQLK